MVGRAGISGDQRRGRVGSAGTGVTPVRKADHELPLERKLLFQDAYMLATMPHGKLAEYTQAAFWAAVATATSGVTGFTDLLAVKPAQSTLLDMAEILIFGICVAITMLGIAQGGKETSEEYLNRLYGIKPEELEKGWRGWVKRRL